MCAGNGGGRIVSEGVTVGGLSCGSSTLTAASMLPSGSCGSSMGESRAVLVPYFGVSDSADDVMY